MTESIKTVFQTTFNKVSVEIIAKINSTPEIKITLITMLIIVTLYLACRFGLKFIYSRYWWRTNSSGINGEEIVRIYQTRNPYVTIRKINGEFNDYYQPETSTICLCQKVMEANSIVAMWVSAHECGHADQDCNGSKIFRLRLALHPVSMFCGKAFMTCIMLGGLLKSIINYEALLQLGYCFFFFYIAFFITNIPVELGANIRAIKFLKEEELLRDKKEKQKIKIFMTVAFLTYVHQLLVEAICMNAMLAPFKYMLGRFIRFFRPRNMPAYSYSKYC